MIARLSTSRMRCALMVAASIIYGCGGGDWSTPASSGSYSAGSQLVDTRGNLGALSGVHPRAFTSGCIRPVVYVSEYNPNSNNAPFVQVYSEHSDPNTPCGSIGGFIQAENLFVDAKHNLWVPDIGARKIFEFTPGASQPALTLDDPEGGPYGVAVDNRNGTVFVANLFNNSGNGTVEVYATGTTEPQATLTQDVAGSLLSVSLDRSENVYVAYITGPGGTGGVLRWHRNLGRPEDLKITLSAPDTVQTTASGSLFVCNGGRAPGCGEVLPGAHSISDTFGNQFTSDVHGALDRVEKLAFTVANFSSAEAYVWGYPGPNRNPRRAIPANCSGCFGIGVATDPPPAPGKRF